MFKSSYMRFFKNNLFIVKCTEKDENIDREAINGQLKDYPHFYGFYAKSSKGKKGH